MSLAEAAPRFEIQQPCAVACISWRPRAVPRFSSKPCSSNILIPTEDLIVGDECGELYYYLVEWSENGRDPWPGSVTLVVRISLHSQQICGLAWSSNGDFFASGGNDNLCALFEVSRILSLEHIDTRQDISGSVDVSTRGATDQQLQVQIPASTELLHYTSFGRQEPHSSFPRARSGIIRFLPNTVRRLTLGCELQKWPHRAAVKAIAFCPWLEGLVATGGGSNDKCIHFFHTISGSSLASIAVAAQVTSLVWSNTKREIAATFGYAHPDHSYRIAVFSWPDCSQIAAIPWEEDLRALHAVPYPCMLRPRSTAKTGGKTINECIVVASSDETIKFYELWSREGGRAVTRPSMFASSDILEDLQGIIKEGGIIR
ncbi:hypothetical protein E4U57_003297 [Claviceps arundinis]|uniref:Uncharacterized protein n=1 Tax=Claviceps arundinis TaxID=1623583 RepID=A0A9P7SMG2_9HYPO|nr:hypothetical protein E4U57_003297 [Claviceps arundinis]KAG5959897.1 hypothetical protein E4U56_004757 [Claviceps arundinis]